MAHTAAPGEGSMWRAGVWHGPLGLLDSTMGTLCCDLGAVCHSTAPWAVVRAVLSGLQNRGYRNGPGALATVHEATLCSWPRPGPGRGKSLSDCRVVLPGP